jgi:hypothetical protein
VTVIQQSWSYYSNGVNLTVATNLYNKGNKNVGIIATSQLKTGTA